MFTLVISHIVYCLLSVQALYVSVELYCYPKEVHQWWGQNLWTLGVALPVADTAVLSPLVYPTMICNSSSYSPWTVESGTVPFTLILRNEKCNVMTLINLLIFDLASPCQIWGLRNQAWTRWIPNQIIYKMHSNCLTGKGWGVKWKCPELGTDGHR